jgi:hypothetical protein
MKNTLLALVSLATFSCERPAELDPDKIFTRFHAILLKGDYSELADELHPSVLRSFRERLEFSTEQPMEGAWFTGSKDRVPTKDELAKIDDRMFFVTYMKGETEIIGNPFIERYRDAKVIASTVGKREYRHFVIQAEDTVAQPAVLSFMNVDGKWLLIFPSFVDLHANRVRAAKGRIPEG